MHLYTFDAAPNPQRLGHFLAHKGIEIETTQIDLMKGEQMQPAYLDINPLGTVPALVLDDGTLLTEVIGMCAYLEELHPERPLLGADALARAQVLSWDHFLYLGVFMAIAEILRNGNPAFEGRALPGMEPVAQIPELVDRGRGRLGRAWRSLDSSLEGRDFLVGDAVTFADVDLLVATGFAGWVKEEVPADCEHLLAWQERARDALGAR